MARRSAVPERSRLTQIPPYSPSPWQAVRAAGGEPALLAPEKEPVQTVSHDTGPAGCFYPDHAVGDVLAEDFAALVLPGVSGSCSARRWAST